jgi:hypothetical protein
MAPMTPGYHPELDVSPLLEPDQTSYYMSLIGILHWAIELGRIDIYIDVTLLSSFLAQPEVGHMNEVLHIFSYLKCHENSKLVLTRTLKFGMKHSLSSMTGKNFMVMSLRQSHPTRHHHEVTQCS